MYWGLMSKLAFDSHYGWLDINWKYKDFLKRRNFFMIPRRTLYVLSRNIDISKSKWYNIIEWKLINYLSQTLIDIKLSSLWLNQPPFFFCLIYAWALPTLPPSTCSFRTVRSSSHWFFWALSRKGTPSVPSPASTASLTTADIPTTRSEKPVQPGRAAILWEMSGFRYCRRMWFCLLAIFGNGCIFLTFFDCCWTTETCLCCTLLSYYFAYQTRHSRTTFV